MAHPGWRWRQTGRKRARRRGRRGSRSRAARSALPRRGCSCSGWRLDTRRRGCRKGSSRWCGSMGGCRGRIWTACAPYRTRLFGWCDALLATRTTRYAPPAHWPPHAAHRTTHPAH
eukprot:6780739-Prymnesium_polylepis.1